MNHRSPIDYLYSGVAKNSPFRTWSTKVKAEFSSRMYWLQWKWHLTQGRAATLDLKAIAPGAIPIVINNFNRFDPLQHLVDWLLNLDNQVSIIIIDNKSTYPPLLEWYDQLTSQNVQVVKLDFNSGLWGIEHVVRQLPLDTHFVITDADLIPSAEMPRDILDRLRAFLDNDAELNHAGASIEIADIPSGNPLKESIQRWEAQFWRKPYACKDKPDVNAFEAPIDTTFAMYRPQANVREVYHSIRLDRPYTLQHVDWYEEPESLSEEYGYYLKRCRPIASWAQAWRQVVES